jgi:hypothetical protein
MKLILDRKYKKETYTIGNLYIDYNNNFDPEYFCNTIEDKVRPKGEKIYGKTAIPAGTYPIVITYSPKFKRELPLIFNIPGFSGVRIHPGNDENDTEGCILVGENKVKGKVINSQITFLKLFNILKTYPQINQIEIK